MPATVQSDFNCLNFPEADSITLQPIAFEICCGSAGLSAELRRLGFQVHAIDHSSNRHTPKVRTLVLDVSNLQQLSLLESMISFTKPCYVHLGLPCGTCSRARERPMPKKLGGHAGPQPLRDANNLLGFAHLSGADLIKVTLANNLYRAANSLLQLCCLIGCLVSLENPARSWLWQLLQALPGSLTGTPSWIPCTLMLVRMAAAVTNGRNSLQPRTFSQSLHKIAQATITMLHGSLFKVILESSFPRRWRQNILHCCASAWQSA